MACEALLRPESSGSTWLAVGDASLLYTALLREAVPVLEQLIEAIEAENDIYLTAERALLERMRAA